MRTACKQFFFLFEYAGSQHLAREIGTVQFTVQDGLINGLQVFHRELLWQEVVTNGLIVQVVAHRSQCIQNDFLVIEDQVRQFIYIMPGTG